MRRLTYAAAIEDALGSAMAADPRIVLLGIDLHTIRLNLYLRFGKERVRSTPISEGAFVGMAVAAAMAGLRPVVEVMMADFLPVAADALVNHAAKLEAFSGGDWQAPVVVRVGVGGGLGDGGQHEQALWGWLAHIPGLAVVVPATPADAGGLLLGALQHNAPVIYMEHKLLADYWREYLSGGGRQNVTFDVPADGEYGAVPANWQPIPLGQAAVRRAGTQISLVSLGVGVHRALQAAAVLEAQGFSVEVIDLRSVAPLDQAAVVGSVRKTGRLVVVDEDYAAFGLAGELAAVCLEAGLRFDYARVALEGTLPFDRRQAQQALPNVERIVAAALQML